MTREELIAKLRAHHSRTDMMDTATLYQLLPEIIAKLEEPRTVDRKDREAGNE